MAIREIVKYPDERLATECSPVQKLDERIQTLIDDMADTMYDAPGIGLAAPQVGEDCRVIVVDTSRRSEPDAFMALINPEIVEHEGELVSEEGCLSVREYNADVKRSSKVRVRALDREGREVDIVAEDLQAIVLQHEIDHLDGILFIDRISRLKRALYDKRLKKNLEKDED